VRQVNSVDEVRRLLKLQPDTHICANGEVQHFATGYCYYRYASHGFIGWIVYPQRDSTIAKAEGK